MLHTVYTTDGSWAAQYPRIAREFGSKIVTIKTPKAAHAVNFTLGTGLLLQGGADVSPIWYGENINGAITTDRGMDRDLIEWALVRRAMTAGVPILGICRGHQMLNVAGGGSLWQDLQRFAPNTKFEHRSTTHPLTYVDPIVTNNAHKDIKKGFKVNSFHHQGVKTVANGFKVVARCGNTVEAIYSPTQFGGMLGVQWHPEAMLTLDQSWDLFGWFFCFDLADMR